MSFSFEGEGAIPKFSLRKAVLRLRLLRWTQATTRSRIMLVWSFIMPCLAWAAGFARPTMEDINAVRNEVRFLFSAGFGGDVATVAFYELLGWGLEPSFALDLGLCKLCWRWVSKPPPWQEELYPSHFYRGNGTPAFLRSLLSLLKLVGGSTVMPLPFAAGTLRELYARSDWAWKASAPFRVGLRIFIEVATSLGVKDL